jgi:hypothetical protein
VILGNFLAFPLWPASWKRPAGSLDYRVTNTFNGPDFLNGGIHRAVDVGNFRSGDPIRAPVACRARGRKHTDGALGVEFDLGGGVVLGLWHLNRVDISLNWGNVARGQLVGVTGNSGARLPNGQPMPAHTHIELKRDAVPFDPEPHLPMANRPAKAIPIEEDDMTVTAIITEDWNTRTGPSAGWFLDRDGVRKHFNTSVRVTTVAELRLADGTNARLVAYGDEGLIMPRANLVPIPGTRVVGLRAADCSAEQNRIDRARTALTGASQALGAAQEALG